MPGRLVIKRLIASTFVLLVLALAPRSEAQWLDKTPGIPRDKDGKPKLDAPAPRAANGKPDLTGLWRVDPGGYGDNIAADPHRWRTVPP